MSPDQSSSQQPQPRVATYGYGASRSQLATLCAGRPPASVLARRAVGDEAFGGLAVLWALVYILGPGLFQPLEQEVARATAARGSRGEGSAPVLDQAARVGALALGVVFGGFALLATKSKGACLTWKPSARPR